MKKILIILSGIFMIFCFLYLNLDTKEKFIYEEMYNDYLGDNLQFIVYSYEGQIIDDEEIKYIIDLANDYNVTVVTNTGTKDNKINQYLIINDIKMFERYQVDDSFNYSSTAVISTNERLSTMGKIAKYDNSWEITKSSFMNIENTQFDTWYYVYGVNKELFYKDFVKKFPNKIELIEQHSDHDHEIYGYNDTYRQTLFKFGFLFMCSSIVILLMYFLNKSREISIMKIEGYGLFKILKVHLMKVTCTMILVDIIILIVMLLINIPIINEVHIPLVIGLAFSIVIKYIMLILIYILVIIYLKLISISTLIKNKKISKYILNINAIMRTCFIFILCISLSKLLPEFRNTIRMMIGYKDFLVTCDDYMHSIAVDGILDDNTFMQIQDFATELQNDDDSIIGISLSNYDNPYDFDYAWVDVNHNYLKEFMIYDINGNQIKDLDDDVEYLLVPEFYFEDEQLYKETIGEMKKFIDFTEIPIENNQKVFTFSILYNEGELGYIYQSPILVTNNISWFKLYYNNVDDMKIKELEKQFLKAGFDLSFHYSYEKDSASYIYDGKVSSAIYEGSFILIYGALLVLLVFQYVILLFDVNKKEYMIKKMNGHSFSHRYINIILFYVSSYMINFIVMKLLGYEGLAFIILITMMLIDILFTSLIVLFIEKKSINSVLKGD